MANSNNMLSIFAGSTILHPYRLQPDVRIIVPFVQYQEFVQIMVSLEYDTLTMPIRNYHDAMSSNDITMLKRFYFCDMAMAVLNEVGTAMRYQVSCTQLLHEFPSAEGVDVVELKNIASLAQELPKELIRKAYDWSYKRLGFKMRIDRLDVDQMWWYAVCLRAYAEERSFKLFRII